MADVSITDILTHSAAIYDAVKSGEFVQAWQESLALQQCAIDGLKGAGFRGAADGAEAAKCDPAKRKEAVANLKNARKELAARKPKGKGRPKNAPKGEGAVGALGDGVLLGKLLDVLIKILPLILS